MTMTDPIADMLARIRNALMARHKEVKIPGSKMKVAIARILKDEGYIEDFKITKDEPQPMIVITLKYDETGKPVITGLKRISKPGRRIYVGRKEIPRVLSGMGIAILSTPKGVITDKQARRLRVGGEVICYVW